MRWIAASLVLLAMTIVCSSGCSSKDKDPQAPNLKEDPRMPRYGDGGPKKQETPQKALP